MKGKLLNLLFISSLIFSVLSVPVASAAHSLEPIIEKRLGSSNVSFSLRSMTTGWVYYAKSGDIPMKPASTLKLLTGSAAIDILGSNYRFETKFFMDGTVQNNALNGDLYVLGGGDPTLGKNDFIYFAKQLKQHGIHTINGNIYGDDTRFSGPQLTPGIAIEEESYYFTARTTALTMSPNLDYDSGTMIVFVKASTNGKNPTVTFEPNLSGMKVLNSAKTTKKGTKNTISVKRNYGTNEIVISGNIPVGYSSKQWVTLQDPTINTLHAMKIILQDSGIKFSNGSTIQRKETSDHLKLIYTKQSIPLEKLMPTFMKLSNNSIADILVKTIGKEIHGEGSTAAGTQAIKEYSSSLGLDPTNWHFEDGSGMSHQNSVSANELTKLLYNVRAKPLYQTFYTSLPVGGQKDRLVGGSLSKRFTSNEYRNRVIAKTGHITGVYTLAGYLQTKSGNWYAFAIMTQNQSRSKIADIDAVVNQIISIY